MTKKRECAGCKRQRVIVGDLHVACAVLGGVRPIFCKMSVPLCCTCLKVCKSGCVNLSSQGAKRRMTAKQLVAQDAREKRAADRHRQATLRGVQ